MSSLPGLDRDGGPVDLGIHGEKQNSFSALVVVALQLLTPACLSEAAELVGCFYSFGRKLGINTAGFIPELLKTN